MSLEFLSLEAIKELAHQYGYITVLLGIMLENTGIPIPGETITLVGGFLAGNGELSYWGVLASAIAGAIVGDSFGYWVGAIGGWVLLVRLGRLFRIAPEKLEQVRHQFRKNAPQAVFLGRFVALLRIFAGPLAGIARMPYPQFLMYNVAGATLWATTMVTLAYFVGRIVPLETLVSSVAQFAVVALLAFGVAIALPVWLERRALRQLPTDEGSAPQPVSEKIEEKATP
jgi:membrane protein DedA with SNARE-associated domain